jgi:hypothetical protein
MVSAYEMESKLAKTPRVLVDGKLVSIARKAHAEQHDGELEARYVKSFMTKDDDGRYYVNYVSWKSVVETAGMEDDDYPAYLRDIGAIVQRNLAKTDPDMLAISVSVTDTISAERGSPLIAANSPKTSPVGRSQSRVCRPDAE